MCAYQIPSRMVMECDRDLNQSLQESLFGSRRSSPHVFQDFMRFKELGFVEELDSAKKGFLIHPAIVARVARSSVPDPVFHRSTSKLFIFQ